MKRGYCCDIDNEEMEIYIFKGSKPPVHQRTDSPYCYAGDINYTEAIVKFRAGSDGTHFNCGIVEMGQVSLEHDKCVTYEEACKLVTQAIEEKILGIDCGKIIASDVVFDPQSMGGETGRFCRAAKWYCSPYPSRNPNSGNMIEIFELGLKPELV